MASTTNPQYMPKAGLQPGLQRSTTSPQRSTLTPGDRTALLGAIAELVEGLRERAESAPPRDREALEAVRSMLLKKARALRGAGRARASRSA